MRGDPVLVTGAAGFVGGHLLELLEQGDDWITAWLRPDTEPSVIGRRVGWLSVRNARPGGGARGHQAKHGPTRFTISPACRTSAIRGRTPTKRSPATCSPPITCSTRSAATASRHGCSSRARRRSTRRRPAPCANPMPCLPNSPYGTSKLAQEMVARRSWRRRWDSGIDRAIVQSRRPAPVAVVRGAEHRETDRGDRGGPEARQAGNGQPRTAARHHGRAGHGARVSRHDAGGDTGRALQRVLGNAGGDSHPGGFVHLEGSSAD